MSTGPGRVERAISDMIAGTRSFFGERASLCFGSEHIAAAAFGERWHGSWTRAEQVSSLRAMRNIMARQPGWRKLRDGHGHRVVFVFEPPEAARAEEVQDEAPARCPTCGGIYRRGGL